MTTTHNDETTLADRIALLIATCPDPDALHELLLIVYGDAFTAGEGAGWQWAEDERIQALLRTVKTAHDAACATRHDQSRAALRIRPMPYVAPEIPDWLLEDR